MENKISNSELNWIKIQNLCSLIARCDELIDNMLSVGISQDDLMIRQEMHMKHRYCEEINAIFQSMHIKVSLVENELKKAA